ncbi:MAG: hypothetical protein JNG82_11100 [Opitutaceae bacterium]|nr:hypothetical protein [Opitutaceae bacterium]
MLEQLVTLDEIAQDRTPADFVVWFDEVLERTRLDDPALRRQILLRQGLAKPVYEEVFPLYRLLAVKQAAWSGRRFRNVLGNQPYDVSVTPAVAGAFSFLEITTADNDQAEAVRMEVFEEKGTVSAISPVTWTGTKRTGRTVEISEDMQLHSDTVKRKRDQLVAAIERKSSRDYPAGTALLVYFDDYVAFADPDDQPVMAEVLAVTRDVWRRKFCALYIIGASGRRLWEQE